MSSIAVAADSTQSEQHCERRKRKTSLERRRKRKETEPKKTKKGQRAEQKKTVKRKQAIKESSDDDSDLDFSKELKPIVGYLDDRKVMVDHLYRTISASKLRAMLPEIMKPLSTAELKQLCLEQLEVMSKKRIRRILEGDNPDTISSSGTEDSGEDDKENKEEAPLNRSREGSPVADSTYQTTWELREWEDQRNESLGLTTRQSGGRPRSRDVELEVESPAEEEGRYGGQEGRQRTHSYSSTDHSPILTLEVQDRSLYEELEDGELPSDDRHRCVSTVHNHPAASPVQQTLNDIPNSEPETIAVSSVQQTLNDIPISEPETIAANSNTLSATSESEANHKTLTATEESHGPPTSTKTSPVLSKTQREILELEMRARAIKAMLKAHEERKRRLALESKMMHSNPK